MANDNPVTEHLQATVWKKGESGNPAGRPKKVLTILQDKGYRKADAIYIIEQLAWCNELELKRMKEDESLPVIVKAMARAYLKSVYSGGAGDLRCIRDILPYLFGKPQQHITISAEQAKNE